MATKKDLVEAYSFSRRRLVTAFVSGAPGGREVEPSRPGRTIVGGIALAVLMIAGLAADGEVTLPELDLADGPLVLVVGSEGKGLSRLVSETCDVRVSIPMTSSLESLNAGVAAGIALYEIARLRGF